MDPTDVNYTGARWQPSAFSVGHTRGNITVNGDVDVAVRGTAVNVGAYDAAEGVHPYDLATVSLVGDSTRIITPYREKILSKALVNSSSLTILWHATAAQLMLM